MPGLIVKKDRALFSGKQGSTEKVEEPREYV